MKNLWRIIIFSCAALFCALPAGAQTGVTVEMGVEGAYFGVGGYFRAGGITAIRLKLTSHLAEPTPVWVQWQVPNADGDIQEIGRSLTLTPNQPAYPWLYAELPPETTQSTVWTVRVFEERDGERGSELGGTRIDGSSAAGQVDITSSMIAVVAERVMGLDDYSNSGMKGRQRPPGSHEDTRVVPGLKPTELPDRWFGLSPFEAIAWAGNRLPQDLGLDQANALREYVARGGHLIITLPDAGNPWGLGVRGQTLIEDLLPCRTEGLVPRQDQSVPLTSLLNVLSKHGEIRKVIARGDPPAFNIRVFKDLRGEFNVIDNSYEPLIALPDGRVIAIQRVYGHGRVTVIGIDLSNGRFQALGLPQADAFWNRVLGRRSDTPTATELRDMDEAGRLGRGDTNYENSLGAGPLITSRINLSHQAHAGLLLALVLFVAYWLVAGPAGFAVLKYYGEIRHAWLAFAACAALFTAIAWGSVGLLPKKMQVKHVTFLDHVARPASGIRTQEDQFQRAVSYFSIYLPDYGDSELGLQSIQDHRDLLTSWSSPGEPAQQFPNVDRYRIDVARSPASYAMPSRSTSTQLYAGWMGGVDPKWGGMLWAETPITVNLEGGVERSLSGSIRNDLPGTLSNVSVFWVKNNRYPRRQYDRIEGDEKPWVQMSRSGQILNSVAVWRFDASDPWLPGKSRDLAKTLVGTGAPLDSTIKSRYIDPYAQNQGGLPTSTGSMTESDKRNYMEMLSIFQQLNPPQYIKSSGPDFDETVSFQRRLGRELDLSAWFTRPCLIIIGYLEDSALPVPLRVDGDDEPPPTTENSLTMVRWIYPLPVDERIAFRDVFERAESETGSDEQSDGENE